MANLFRFIHLYSSSFSTFIHSFYSYHAQIDLSVAYLAIAETEVVIMLLEVISFEISSTNEVVELVVCETGILRAL